ncbi:hypothetical protein PROFUN_08146 [Planoprotostelium fungivorum]|uniref:Rap-GAP domain-containing protein n=1 Tax=Planoprotostelium fungivorum TaxID=1890364 RepID=A0A2P6MQH8_9EUKA|nr:hypothetical protein PROFUN_08146 [Planoprotostelium fungivorum]
MSQSQGSRDGIKNVFKKFQSILTNTNNGRDKTLREVNVSRYDEFELGREEQKRITRDFIRRLSPSETNRLQYIKDFEELVKSYQMDDLLSLWHTIEDLVHPDSPKDTVEVVLQFLCAFVQGQYHHLGSLRISLFGVAQDCGGTMETRMRLMRAITNDGREVNPFTMEIGRWIIEGLSKPDPHCMDELLTFTSNIIKYNFIMMESETISCIIKSICFICDHSTVSSTLEQCLRFFDVLVRYGHITPDTLPNVISSLCKTVNIDQFTKTSWHCMNNILKSDYGYRGFTGLTELLSNETHRSNVDVCRGAIFFLSMCVWGPHRIHPFHSLSYLILPTMYNSLSSNQVVIYNEVLLSIHRLIKKYGHELKMEWDLLIMIMKKLDTLHPKNNFSPKRDRNSPATEYHTIYAETLSCIGELLRKDCFYGDRQQINDLLEMFVQIQHESVVLLLIEDRVERCKPFCDHWQKNVETLISKYLYGDDRPSIQEKVIKELTKMFVSLRGVYEDDMLQHIVGQLTDSQLLSSSIKRQILHFYVEVASVCSPKYFGDMLEAMDDLYNGEPNYQQLKSEVLIRLFDRRFDRVEGLTIPIIYRKILNVLRREASETILLGLYTLLFRITGDESHHLKFDDHVHPMIRLMTSMSKQERDDKTINVEDIIRCALLHSTISQPLFVIIWKGIRNMLVNGFVFPFHLTETLISGVLSILRSNPQPDWFSKNRLNVNYSMLEILKLTLGLHDHVSKDRQRDVLTCFVHQLNLLATETSQETEVRRLQELCLDSLSICIYELREIISFGSLQSLFRPPHSWVGLQRDYLEMDYRSVFLFFLPILANIQNTNGCNGLVFQALGGMFLSLPNKWRMEFFEWISQKIPENITDIPIVEAFVDLIYRYAVLINVSHYNTIPLPSNLFDGKNDSQSWISHNCIITIQCGAMGYSNVTVRSPSSRIQYSIYIPYENEEKVESQLHLLSNEETEVTPPPMSPKILPAENSRPSVKESDFMSLLRDSLSGAGKLEESHYNITRSNSGDDVQHRRQSPDPVASELQDHHHQGRDLKLNRPNAVLSHMQHLYPFVHPQTTLLRECDALRRGLSVLDSLPGYCTHKIGVLYVAINQSTEDHILSNQYGSPGYHKFLESIGSIVRLKDCKQYSIYTGGLDTGEQEEEDNEEATDDIISSPSHPDDDTSPSSIRSDRTEDRREQKNADGDYGIYWMNSNVSIMYHVTTLMPNMSNDPQFTNKKRHIGNDNVTIVYSDSHRDYSNDTVRGQFNFVSIIIYPIGHGMYRIHVKKKPEVPDFGPIPTPMVVSDRSLAQIVRQLALNADMACWALNGGELCTNNVEERIRQIKMIGSRLVEGNQQKDSIFKNNERR